jgi:hypothetical protein
VAAASAIRCDRLDPSARCHVAALAILGHRPTCRCRSRRSGHLRLSSRLPAGLPPDKPCHLRRPQMGPWWTAMHECDSCGTARWVTFKSRRASESNHDSRGSYIPPPLTVHPEAACGSGRRTRRDLGFEVRQTPDDAPCNPSRMRDELRGATRRSAVIRRVLADARGQGVRHSPTWRPRAALTSWQEDASHRAAATFQP